MLTKRVPGRFPWRLTLVCGLLCLVFLAIATVGLFTGNLALAMRWSAIAFEALIIALVFIYSVYVWNCQHRPD